MSQWEPSQTCATIGQLITNAVLKELLAGQLQRGLEPVDASRAQALLNELAPNIAKDILETASGWIPVAAEVSPESLLPDLDQFPPAPHNVEGLTVQQRKLLLEAIEIILDVFNDPSDENEEELDEHQPHLPRPSIACISAQVASVLEHLTILRPRNAATACHDADLDLADWQRVHAAGCDQRTRSSREELIEEVQQCRQRIFEVEKEFAVQANHAAAQAARAKRDHTQMAARLLNVNRALEVKCKQQAQEAKDLHQQVFDLGLRVTYEQARAEQKDQQTKQLQEELSKQVRMQDDMLVREKEYGRRILTLHLGEFESTVRNDHRLKALSSVMSGRTRTETEIDIRTRSGTSSPRAVTATESTARHELNAEDLADLAKRTLESLERDFDGIFEERQRRFKEVVKKQEARLQDRQSRFLAICEQTKKDTLVNHGRLSSPKAGKFLAVRRQCVDAEAQTEPEARSPMQWESEGQAGTTHSLPPAPVAKSVTDPVRHPVGSTASAGRTGSRLNALIAAGPTPRSEKADSGARYRAGSALAAAAPRRRLSDHSRQRTSNDVPASQAVSHSISISCPR